MKKKCLVVGANGFIGSHLIDALVAHGYPVTAFDRFSGPQQFGNAPQITVVRGDFQDSEAVRLALEGVKVVFHYLWTTNPGSSVEKGPIYEVDTNLTSTLQLLDLCAKNGVEKIIFPSTSTVYGRVSAVPVAEDHRLDPETPHAIAKVATERFLAYYYRVYGLESSVFRIGNVYGPGQDPVGGLGFIGAVLGKIHRGEKPVVFGDGSVVRDFVFIKDVVAANLAALETESVSQLVMNLGSGRGRSLSSILAKIETVLGQKIEVNYQPRRVADIPKVILDIRRISQELGFRPRVRIEDGITQTWNWIQRTC